jgi:anti-sigma regulatory factor (Ser/Thr protein kinase)
VTAAAGSYYLHLSTSRDAPAVGRAFITHHTGHLPAEVVDDAILLASELITNAVTHGEPDITMQLRLSPPSIGVAVTDHGLDLPSPRQPRPSPGAVHGRGLRLIDALASTWGIDSVHPGPGKTIWFHIEKPTPAS